jgi:hypothetical protein
MAAKLRHHAWCLSKIGGRCDCGLASVKPTREAKARKVAKLTNADRASARLAKGDRCSILCVLEDGHRGKCKVADPVTRMRATLGDPEMFLGSKSEALPHNALPEDIEAAARDARVAEWKPLPGCRCGPGGAAIHSERTKESCR